MSFVIENNVLKKYEEEPGVTEVVIPKGVTSIGDRAFDGCESLTSITIPKSVTSIGKDAFEDVSDNFKIICSKGTVAEQYAIDYGIDYEIMG